MLKRVTVMKGPNGTGLGNPNSSVRNFQRLPLIAGGDNGVVELDSRACHS